MENMRIAGSHVDEEKVRETARVLGIDRWLESLPDGYDTPLGVGGIRLSSGQTQKVAILRAVLKQPRLLLLDEITSAMDVESERHILDGLNALRPDECITVMTTHRLTLTMEPWVSRIVVLDDGSVVEQGTPQELYRSGGEYRRLMTLAGLGNLVWRKVEDSV
jgi:ATP-binding cassette subfamily B protein